MEKREQEIEVEVRAGRMFGCSDLDALGSTVNLLIATPLFKCSLERGTMQEAALSYSALFYRLSLMSIACRSHPAPNPMHQTSGALSVQ